MPVMKTFCFCGFFLEFVMFDLWNIFQSNLNLSRVTYMKNICFTRCLCFLCNNSWKYGEGPIIKYMLKSLINACRSKIILILNDHFCLLCLTFFLTVSHSWYLVSFCFLGGLGSTHEIYNRDISSCSLYFQVLLGNFHFISIFSQYNYQGWLKIQDL